MRKSKFSFHYLYLGEILIIFDKIALNQEWFLWDDAYQERGVRPRHDGHTLALHWADIYSLCPYSKPLIAV